MQQVDGAREHARQRGWAHMDLSPSNIIYVPESGYRLIDWGCAAKIGASVGYVGTPPFSHPVLFSLSGDSTTKVTEWFDKFSLAASVCVLLHGKVPWGGFNRPATVEDDALRNRLRLAEGLVNSSSLPNKMKVTLWEYLLSGEKPRPTTRPRPKQSPAAAKTPPKKKPDDAKKTKKLASKNREFEKATSEPSSSKRGSKKRKKSGSMERKVEETTSTRKKRAQGARKL